MGLRPGATLRDCKLAYFTLAKKVHPDASSGQQSAADFCQLNDAYETLTEYYRKNHELEVCGLYDSYDKEELKCEDEEEECLFEQNK